jgi:hypothetical protein
MSLVCRGWRHAVSDGFPGWLRERSVGTVSEPFSVMVLWFVRRHVESELLVCKVGFVALLTQHRAVIAGYGITLTCDLGVGECAWKLVWSGGIPPFKCGSRWRCDCEVVLRGAKKVGAGYLVVRGVPESLWCHRRTCDVCVSRLSSTTLDRLLDTILPFFLENRRGRLSPLATPFGPWRPTFVWRDKLYHHIHDSMLRCVRR